MSPTTILLSALYVILPFWNMSILHDNDIYRIRPNYRTVLLGFSNNKTVQ